VLQFNTSELHLVLWFTKESIMMDDWKLKTSPVVRLERQNERFVDSHSHCVLVMYITATLFLEVNCSVIKWTKLLT